MRRDEGGEDEIRMRESIGKNQAPGANPGIGVALVALLAPFFFTFFSRPLIELQLSTPRGATRGTSAAGVANYFRTASFIQARERARSSGDPLRCRDGSAPSLGVEEPSRLLFLEGSR
jgi:hypothetical protein